MNETMINDSLLARFDAFASDAIPDIDTFNEMLDDARNSDSDASDESIILDMIDAQFDDDFAFITESDDNAHSLFLEYIESNRSDFTIFLASRMLNMIDR